MSAKSHRTPGTRVTWSSLGGWLDGLDVLVARCRRASSVNDAAVERHRDALHACRELIENEADLELLRRLQTVLFSRSNDLQTFFRPRPAVAGSTGHRIQVDLRNGTNNTLARRDGRGGPGRRRGVPRPAASVMDGDARSWFR